MQGRVATDVVPGGARQGFSAPSPATHANSPAVVVTSPPARPTDGVPGRPAVLRMLAPSDVGVPGTFAMSQAVSDFLSTGLKIPVGTSTTLTGTLNGSVLTVSLANPAANPIALPAGLGSVAFTGTTVSVDVQSKAFELTTSAVVAGTTTISVDAKITDATSATPSIDVAVTVSALAILATQVDIGGHLTYAGGKLAGSLTGALAADFNVTPSVVVKQGSTITLDSAGSISVTANVAFGANSTPVVVSGTFAITNANVWTLTFQQTTGGRWQPLSGLTITPNVTGSIAKSNGKVIVHFTADNVGSWTPAAAFSVAISHIEVGNDTAPTACIGANDGDLWMTAGGTATVFPAGMAAFALGASACVDVTSGAFAMTTSQSAQLPDFAPGVMLMNVKLAVNRNPATGEVKVSGAGRGYLGVMLPIGGYVGMSFNLILTVHSDGTLVVGVTFDSGQMSAIGLSAAQGEVFVSTKDIAGYRPTDDFPMLGSAPVNLKTGVNIRLGYTMDPRLTQALSTLLHVQVPTTAQAVATLSPAGFAMTVGLDFSAAPATIVSYGQTTLTLTGLNFGVSVGAVNTVNISALGRLTVKSPYADTVSTVDVTASGSYDVNSQSFSIGFGLAPTACTANVTPCRWDGAFGVPGLSVGTLAVQFGLNLAVPFPTLSISANNISLPKAWGDAIGVDSGANFSIDLAISTTQPILHVAIAGAPLPGGGRAVAVRPLTLAKYVGASQATIDSFTVSLAELYLAPSGGTTAAGRVIQPGLSVVFDGTLFAVPVHVDASIGFTPSPHLDANINVGSFTIGSARIDNTIISFHAGTDGFSFNFAGGYSANGFSFSVKLTVNGSTTLLNAAISLKVTAGLPAFLDVAGTLDGNIRASGNGFTFSVSGTGTLNVSGHVSGSVSVSYSADFGMVWQQISGSAQQFAQDLKTYFNYGADQIQAAMTSVHIDSATVLTALNSLGLSGQQFVTAIVNLFNTGREFIWNGALVLDVAAGSQSPGAAVLQYTWKGTNNQKWMEVPAGNGWIEIVNVNSGQCLTPAGYSTAAMASIVQMPCVGAASQKWYKYSDGSIRNQGSWLWLEVYGNSKWIGAPIDQYWWNYGSNQYWNETWAA